LLVLLPEGDVQFALAAEVVVKAAHARPGSLDDLSDARRGEALLDEDLARCVKQRTLRLRRPRPLPGTRRGPAARLPRR
jgi:hypothetical protein